MHGNHAVEHRESGVILPSGEFTYITSQEMTSKQRLASAFKINTTTRSIPDSRTSSWYYFS